MGLGRGYSETGREVRVGMEFTIRGVSFGEEVELTWRDGEVTGHEGRAALLKRKARIVRRVDVGASEDELPLSPGGEDADHLANPYGAYHLMKWGIFQEIVEESGEVPVPPARTPGAR